MLKNFDTLTFPSNHQIVILDSDTNKAEYLGAPHLPMTFWIDYRGDAKNPPSLTLMINPQTMAFSLSKKVNTMFARDGYIVEEWGENQDVITCSGTIGGYYIKDATNYSGLNRYDRKNTLSFQNLMSLFFIYRNNGAVFQSTLKEVITKLDDSEDIPKKPHEKLIKSNGLALIKNRVPNMIKNANNRILKMGDLYLSYDNTIYLGSFDSFSITENAEKPFNLDYEFQFSVLYRRVSDYRNFENYYQKSAKQCLEATKYVTSVNMDTVKNYINIESKSLENEKAYNAPQSISSNVTYNELPNALADMSIKYLNDNGYETTTSDKQSFTLIYLSANNKNKSYSDDITFKDSLVEQNKEVISRTESNDEIINQKAQNFASIQKGIADKEIKKR